MRTRLVLLAGLLPAALFAQKTTTSVATRPISFLDRQLQRDIGSPTPSPDGILLQATIMTNSLATDLNGNLVWYYPGDVTFITRPEAGGYFFGIVENQAGDQSQQIVREFDLTGMTVLETNAARVNEQLAAMGKRPISAFHHEARRLPDGRILPLIWVQSFHNGYSGPYYFRNPLRLPSGSKVELTPSTAEATLLISTPKQGR